MDRIPTTHVGSLPRPSDVFELLEEKERTSVEPAGFAKRVKQAVFDIVEQQRDCGIDYVGDGEVSKFSYTFYVRHRLQGVGTADQVDAERPKTAAHRDLLDHPELLQRIAQKTKAVNWYEMVPPPVCIAPIDYVGQAALTADLKNLSLAVSKQDVAGAFVNSASPGVLTKFVPDCHYGDEDDYLSALVDAMRTEYQAIHAAGFMLQIDAPDLASARHNQYQSLTDKEFRRIAARNIEGINAATAGIPAESIRMHVCWGNYEGPHTHDIPFSEITDLVFAARPAAILFEGANPRHAHEWEDLTSVEIPEDKILIPGVIDTTTNFVEHPRLVEHRLMRYADLVGRERVIAGTDCGFATFAGPDNAIVPSVVWAKLRSLAEGATIASERLWP
ncbi:MAG: cobalamin-independent methionine synthase II family protein [Pseudomonadota bacterium]